MPMTNKRFVTGEREMERRSVDRLSQDVSHQGYDIEQHITVASSPSIILDGIERYFNKRGRIHRLIVPLREVGMPGTLALERRVTVELKRYPSSSAAENRLEFRWFPAGETVPSFIGTFAVRPQGADTQLVLSGRYQPPFEGLTREFGAVFDHETAQGTGRLLLEELKAVLETETDALNEFNREELEIGAPVPQVGWRATRGRF
ncbi:MAG: hypothetical protein WA668_16300 [Candidatus Cybelea sp.]